MQEKRTASKFQESEIPQGEANVSERNPPMQALKRLKLKTKLKNEIALEIHFGAIFFMLYYII